MGKGSLVEPDRQVAGPQVPAEPPPATVLVLSDRTLLASGLATMLYERLGVVAATGSLRRWGDVEPHVVVVDLPPQRSAAQALLDALARRLPTARVVALNGQPTADPARAGTWQAETSVEELLTAVRSGTVRGGAAWTSRGGPPSHDVDDWIRLTARERQVVELCALELDEDTAARQLGLSPHTIRTHVRNAAAKLGVPPHELLAAAAQRAAQIGRSAYQAPRLASAPNRRVALVGHSPWRLAALQGLLVGAPDVDVVAAFVPECDGCVRRPEAVADVAVIDADEPRSAATLTRALRAGGEVAVVVTGPPDSGGLLRDVLAAGATAYVPTDLPGSALLTAVRAVAVGDAFLPAHLLTRYLDAERRRREREDEALRALLRLTPAERTVVAMLGSGHSDESIATTLVVSPHTVRSHVQNVLRKFNAASRAEVLAAVTEHQLVARFLFTERANGRR